MIFVKLPALLPHFTLPSGKYYFNLLLLSRGNGLWTARLVREEELKRMMIHVCLFVYSHDQKEFPNKLHIPYICT